MWEASALKLQPALVGGTRALLRDVPIHEDFLELAPALEGEAVSWDYKTLGLTLRSHPLALLRPQLAAMGLLDSAQLRAQTHGRLVRTSGLVTMRQQPQTAKGTIFVTLEDEHGSTNVIVWKRLREKSETQRRALLHARLLIVYGRWEQDASTGGQVRHLIAGHLRDITPILGDLLTSSRDFH